MGDLVNRIFRKMAILILTINFQAQAKIHDQIKSNLQTQAQDNLYLQIQDKLENQNQDNFWMPSLKQDNFQMQKLSNFQTQKQNSPQNLDQDKPLTQQQGENRNQKLSGPHVLDQNEFEAQVLGFLQSQIKLQVHEHCEELIDDCSYYACLEAEYHCGKKGYPTAFGQRYCLRFEDQIDRFTEQGKDFVGRARTCLMEQLQMSEDLVSCRALKKKAFKDHSYCYEKAGYCELEKPDRKAINKVVRPSMWRWGVIKSGIKLKNMCRAKRERES